MTPTASGKVSFNRDIRPILSDACLHCHGFDPGKRKAGLRLDTFEGATEARQGRPAIRPGDPGSSEVWRRITSTNASVQMPPPDSGKHLAPAQIALLKRWIEQGAAYQKHWAFEPPKRSELPPVRQTAWPHNELDRFILASLEAARLAPSKEAPRETLLRRVTLDLTGLSPTLEEMDAFLADQAEGAYERAVDRLLASPRYGEHMAHHWLDVARYGDTHGLHLDNERSIWPYRDWVVAAFNRNLPFDQFTVEQLAGDLLPEATREQKVASGFNRCNVTTSEGGAIDEEFQVRYAVDRVETTSTAWLGLTMGCAVCHDHKLDPITQKEFYQVFSIFNNLTEKPMDGNALLPPPTLKLPAKQQEERLEALNRDIAALEKRLTTSLDTLSYTDPATVTNSAKPAEREFVWIDDDFPAGASPRVNEGNSSNRWVTTGEASVYSGKRAIERVGTNISQVFFEGGAEPLVVGAGDRLFAYVRLDPTNTPKAVMLQLHVNGKWSKRANWGDEDVINYGKKGSTEKVQAGGLPEREKWVRLEVRVAKLGLRPGTKITGLAFTQYGGRAWWDKAGLVSVNDPVLDPTLSLIAWQKFERDLGEETAVEARIKELLHKDAAKLVDSQRQTLRHHFLEKVYARRGEEITTLSDEVKACREKRDALEKEIPATLISKELDKPRPAWVLIRGQYDKHGEPVGPGVPSVLPPLPADTVTNRLTLARWLVSSEHPLTARVTVNRFWQQFFGIGLVKTSGDFGSRGEWPSHPELLDWLATGFMHNGWDVKRFVKMIVTSATYRQASTVTPELLEVDPDNRLLARGPRQRLDAEVLRDNTLFLSGLLDLTMGGRGVRPYQPSGIWEAVGYTTSNTAKYSQDKGGALYRRSLYTFWKRTAPPPAMTTFDAPSRESCVPRRERTNTPLQALVTMNDPQFFEAARHLGRRMACQGGATDQDRLRFGFRLVTGRFPSDVEIAVLKEAFEAYLDQYGADVAAAKKVIAVGESPASEGAPPAQLAAYAMVGNLLLNLDEVVTKN